MIGIKLGADLIKFVDQPGTLVLRERAVCDQCMDLSDEQCNQVLWRLCFWKSYRKRIVSDWDDGRYCIRSCADYWECVGIRSVTITMRHIGESPFGVMATPFRIKPTGTVSNTVLVVVSITETVLLLKISRSFRVRTRPMKADLDH